MKHIHASRLAAAALSVCCGGAAAHGGLSMDEDTCKLRVGRYLMHFAGYQPEGARGPREFCEDIPETGRTIVVLDYLNDELRDLPTEVRIIRDTGSEVDLERVTVLHLQAKRYPTGSLNFELNFTEPGKFVGLVTVGDAEKLTSRFPFSVGASRAWLRIAAPILVLLVGGVALYRFGLRRRARAGAAAS